MSYIWIQKNYWLWIGFLISLLVVSQGATALVFNIANYDGSLPDVPAKRWADDKTFNTIGGEYLGYIYEYYPYEGSYIIGYIGCPLTLTGEVCNRPPLFSSNDPRVTFDLPTENVIGYTEVFPRCECLNSRFSDLVPNGVNYPSDGEWDIPFDGKHYYARLTVSSSDWEPFICLEGTPDACTRWLYRTPVRFTIDTSVGDGSYLFHIQRDKQNVGDTDWAVGNLNVQYGEVDINLKKYENGDYVTIPQPFHANITETIKINGTNTDSDTSYMWLTGNDLPACGINLMATSLADKDPFIVYTNPDGKFPTEYSWDLSTLPISLTSDAATYEIVMSSVAPFENENICSACGSSVPCGIKGLYECGPCGKENLTLKRFPITLIRPGFDATLTSEVERCCCPGPSCGSQGGNEKIELEGISQLNEDNNPKQLQIWIFSESGSIGGEKLLFDYLTTDCDGKFKYDLNKDVFQKNNITLCEMDPGQYTVILQNMGLNERYDVIPDKYITDGIYEPEPYKQFVVSSYPVQWTKSFMFDGSNSEPTNKFLSKFEEMEKTVDDKFITLHFTIKRGACEKGGSVDFTANTLIGNSPLNVTFTGTSSSNVTTWAWDFGDGTQLSGPDPIVVHKYVNENLPTATYSVTLSVTIGTDEPVVMKKGNYISVIKSPEVGFEVQPSSGFTWDTFQFTDLTSDNPSSWYWNFGDGATTNLQSPTHVYSKPGIYTINLTVSNQYGLSNSYYQDVLVKNDPPEALFSASRNITKTYPAQINFIDESTGGGIYSWVWNFGDNTTSTRQNPSHLFTEPGTYHVYLTVENNGDIGETPEPGYQIIIGDIYSPDPNPKPVSFSAVPTLGNTPLSVQFTDTSDMAGISWNWTFGDGGVSNLKNPEYVYETKGTYAVSLEVNDGTMVNTTMIKDCITVVDVPIIDFSFVPVSVYPDEEIQFTDQSTGNPTSWMWDFGNEDTSSLQSPVYSYPLPGTYPVTLTVSNAFGIGTPVTKDIVIMNDGPTAMFSANPLNSTSYPAEVYFTDTSIGDEIISWLWSFGDGGTSTTKNPIHIYTLPGVFNVSLTVANNGGTNTTEKLNYITIGGEPGDGYTLNIYPKWNHFSVPAALDEDKDTVAEVFEGIDRGGEPAYIYSNELGDYEAIDEDTILVPQTMYKIWYNRNDQNKVVFEYKDWEGTYSRKLETGWNGIGITGPVPVPASEALKSLGTAWDKLIWYDGNKQDWMGPVERGKTDYTLMYPIYGYMIDMNADATLEG